MTLTGEQHFQTTYLLPFLKFVIKRETLSIVIQKILLPVPFIFCYCHCTFAVIIMYFLPVPPIQKFNNSMTSFPVAAFSLLGRKKEGKGRENGEKEIKTNHNSVKLPQRRKLAFIRD